MITIVFLKMAYDKLLPEETGVEREKQLEVFQIVKIFNVK